MTVVFPSFLVAGVRIHAIRVADVVSTIDEWIAARHPDYIVLTGAHGVVEMQSDRGASARSTTARD